MLYPDHHTLALLIREHHATLRQQAQRVHIVDARPRRAHTSRVRLAAAVAISALGVITATTAAVAGDAPASVPIHNPSAGTVTLPGDSPVPFWPHETGARLGTSETYVDVRDDGSYLDPGTGGRVLRRR